MYHVRRDGFLGTVLDSSARFPKRSASFMLTDHATLISVRWCGEESQDQFSESHVRPKDTVVALLPSCNVLSIFRPFSPKL